MGGDAGAGLVCILAHGFRGLAKALPHSHRVLRAFEAGAGQHVRGETVKIPRQKEVRVHGPHIRLRFLPWDRLPDVGQLLDRHPIGQGCGPGFSARHHAGA